jgi:uncharacterized protein YraI
MTTLQHDATGAPQPLLNHRRWVVWSLALALALLLTGCGLFAAEQSDDTMRAIRTPKPTFTPTAAAPTIMHAQPVVTPVPPAPAETAPSPAEGGALPSQSPKAVINGPLVNIRSGPGTQFDIVATAERGAEYDIIARNPAGDWWNICCINGIAAWVIADFVDTDGAVDGVPISGGASAQAAAPTAPPQPTVPVVQFDLRTQEQFPETATVRIFMYVYSGNLALEGYSLRVTKDGIELPVTAVSFGGQPAFTWPFQDARQRHQNFKVEFPGTPPAGTWDVQLIDGNRATVGPTARFTLRDSDPEQELYVRYERR